MYKFYNFKCDKCHDDTRDACWSEDLPSQICLKCGGALITQQERISSECATYIPFKAGWYEHIAREPLYIKDKYALRKACKDHNMGSAYLDDM